jgi:hypothetical protein
MGATMRNRDIPAGIQEIPSDRLADLPGSAQDEGVTRQ